MSKVFAVALLAITAATLFYKAHDAAGRNPHFPVEVIQAFKEWQGQHNKMYSRPGETFYRLAIFAERLASIKAHNAKPDQTYTQGLNQFSDMTYEEFLIKFTGDLNQEQFESLGEENSAPLPLGLSQGGWDWTQKGAVNPVQNQGQCGGCWSFAATASFEAAYFNKFNTLMKFSEQAGIDCDKGNSGCGGGSPDTAMAFQKQYGLPALSDYPYTAQDGTCKLAGKKVSKSLNFSYSFPSSASLLQAAIQKGVTYISIYANQNFMNYKSGIFSDPNCSTGPTNHAVAAVGYDAGMTYWKIRNSWGAQWGEAGYVRMQNLAGTYGTCYMFKRNAVTLDVNQYGPQ